MDRWPVFGPKLASLAYFSKVSFFIKFDQKTKSWFYSQQFIFGKQMLHIFHLGCICDKCVFFYNLVVKLWGGHPQN